MILRLTNCSINPNKHGTEETEEIQTQGIQILHRPWSGTKHVAKTLSVYDKMGKMAPGLEQEECLSLCVHGQLMGRDISWQLSQAETE